MMDANLQTIGGSRAVPDGPAAKGGGPDPSGDALARPRFRILQRGEWRRAIKLEEVFWTALEDLADEKSMKLTDYVREVLGSRPEGSNQTAELRVHAARRLYDQLGQAEQQLREFGPAGMLQAVPAPGFVIGPARGLTAFNGEFLRLVRRFAALEDPGKLPQARLNLDAPLTRIKDLLLESRPRPIECGFTMSIDRRTVRGRVRACLAPGPNGRMDVMGFVIAMKDEGEPERSVVGTGAEE